MFLVRMFGIPLLVTVVTEEIGALVWGARSPRDLLTILWINAITNPSVVALRYLSDQIVPSAAWRTVILIGLELLVLVVEWRLFRRFLTRSRHPFLMSLTLNAASYGAGLLVPVILTCLHAHTKIT